MTKSRTGAATGHLCIKSSRVLLVAQGVHFATGDPGNPFAPTDLAENRVPSGVIKRGNAKSPINDINGGLHNGKNIYNWLVDSHGFSIAMSDCQRVHYPQKRKTNVFLMIFPLKIPFFVGWIQTRKGPARPPLILYISREAAANQLGLFKTLIGFTPAPSMP